MKHDEELIQSECVKWLWNEHPETRELFICINNNSETAARAMKRKALGVVPGAADTMFLWKGKVYFIEFKTKTGRQSVRQKRWERKVNEHLFDYLIVRSVEQFKRLILNIFELTKDRNINKIEP